MNAPVGADTVDGCPGSVVLVRELTPRCAHGGVARGAVENRGLAEHELPTRKSVQERGARFRQRRPLALRYRDNARRDDRGLQPVLRKAGNSELAG